MGFDQYCGHTTEGSRLKSTNGLKYIFTLTQSGETTI
jgi:hypothetical protein